MRLVSRLLLLAVLLASALPAWAQASDTFPTGALKEMQIVYNISGGRVTGTKDENRFEITKVLSPQLTETPSGCAGDCDGKGTVTVDEILTMVNIALGDSAVSACEAGDANGDGQITVDEILVAVNSALSGCSGRIYCRTPSGGLPIPDDDPLGGVRDTMTIAEAPSITNVKVQLQITHSWVGDLVVTLQHVDTLSGVTLIDRPGVPGISSVGCGHSNLLCTLDDAATAAVEDQCADTDPAIAGTLRPKDPLSTFNGESSAGDWILSVYDEGLGDTGSLVSWCLEVNATAPPGPDVVAGPDGTSVTLPPEARTTGSIPSLVSADGSGLAAPGETLVSSAITLTVTGTEPMVGNGTFPVTIPVTGTVGDPEKLLLKVMLADGTAYPVAGVYDATLRTFTVELMALWDGWKMAVVSNADLTTIPPTAEQQDGGVAGWETPDDWKTCAFVIKNEVPAANAVPAVFANTTLPNAMKRVCDELRAAEFRSPKLWIDSRLQPRARVAHLVRGVNGPISTHFEPCVKDPPDPTCNEDSHAFTLSGLTEEQMLALGQVFVNYDEIQTLGARYGVTLENVAIHELFHAVQWGYDYRKRVEAGGGTYKAYADGTATLVGHTFQANHGIFGGDVYLRPWLKPLPLDERLDDFTTDYYERQDYFAYLAKRFTGGSLTSFRWLFQAMSDQTAGKFGLSHQEYLTLYRRAMDIWLSQAWGKGLSEVYADFALDRAYRHPAYARLRPSETALQVNSFDQTVFKTDMTWDPVAQPTDVLPDLPPLATSTFSITIPDSAKASGALALSVAVNGVALSPDGVRITVFREQGGSMVPSQGEIAVTDVSTPVTIPVGPDVDGLRVFVSNCAIENRSAQVTFTFIPVEPPPGNPTVTVDPPSGSTFELGTGAWFTITATPVPGTTITRIEAWRVKTEYSDYFLGQSFDSNTLTTGDNDPHPDSLSTGYYRAWVHDSRGGPSFKFDFSYTWVFE